MGRPFTAKETGDYLVLVDPNYGETLQAQVLLASGTTGGEAVDGAEGEYATTVPGQNVYLTFVASEGQRLGLGISDLVVSTGTHVSVNVYRPDGSALTNTTCRQTYGGCGLNINANQSGTYRVVVSPQNGSQTASFKTSLSTDLAGTLLLDQVQSLTLPRRGQNARLRFAATAGQTVALQVAGQTTVPAERTVYYYIYRPNGALLTSTTTKSGTTLNLSNLPETGDYLVLVDPNYGEMLQAQVLLASGTTGGEAVDGAEGEYATTVPGQNVYLTFVASEGQRPGLGISDLVVSTGTYVSVNAYRPDGSALTNTTCRQTYGGCGLNINANQSGTYRVVVSPQNGSQTASFKTTLSTDLAATLPLDTVQTLALGRRGQNARLTFAGTAGQTLALQVAGQTTTPSGRQSYYRVYRPNGTQLATTSTTGSATLNLPNLPETGNYEVFVDPYYGETLQAQLTLQSR